MPDDTPTDERCDGCGRLDPAACPCPSEPRSSLLEDVVLPLATSGTLAAISDVADERVRQVRMWGVQSHPDGTGGYPYPQAAELAKAHTDQAADDGTLSWTDILLEEVYEALAETDPDALRTELVQVAAVAASWVEDIDRRGLVERYRAAAEGAVIDAAITDGRLPLRSPGDGQ